LKTDLHPGDQAARRLSSVRFVGDHDPQPGGQAAYPRTTLRSAKAFGEAVEEAAAPPPKSARSAAKPTSAAQGPSENHVGTQKASPPPTSSAASLLH